MRTLTTTLLTATLAACGAACARVEPTPAEWKGNKIVSRVLPYPDFNSLFIRLPIAHCAAIGRGVNVAVLSLGDATEAKAIVERVAPGASVRTYDVREHRDDLIEQLAARKTRIALIPMLERWDPEKALELGREAMLSGLLLVVASDLSTEDAQIDAVNQLHGAGALTVGRVDRQATLCEPGGDDNDAFNPAIGRIKTSLFSTVGLEGGTPERPAATAAGVAALVLEKWPESTPSEVRQRLIDGARPAWQATSIETGRWNSQGITVDPVTTEYRVSLEREEDLFRFRVLDAPGALGVDTDNPWFLNMLNMREAWTITKGEGAVVLVSDQGFHVDHPTLKPSIVSKRQFGPLGFDSPGQNFHGTEMARILLALAPEAKIIPALCSSQGGNMDELAANIAASFRAAKDEDASVLSASWSARFTAMGDVMDAVRETADSGIVVSWFHAESHPGVLRSAFTYSGRSADARPGFSDRFLTDPPGFRPAEIEAGLSGTAPQAAGIAALVRCVNAELTPPEIQALIHKYGDDIGGGARIPNVHRILLAARAAAADAQ